ncbi:MAG: hypothetical protein ACFCVF_07400 [Kineosporiaceae bacterium]
MTARLGRRAQLVPALATLASLATAVVVLVTGAAPAAAHGGELVVDVAGDGGNGVGLVATWKSDGHPVGPEVQFEMTAARATGPAESVGPLEIPLSNEGSGFRSLPNVLTPGEWTVTVVATGAGVDADTVGARTEAVVVVADGAVPSPTTVGGADPGTAGAGGDPAPDASAVAASAARAPATAFLAVLVAVLAVLAAVIVVAVRSRHRPAARRRA